MDRHTDVGDHGYDNRLTKMRTIFGAYGPSIRPKLKVPPFQNIELYNLFTDLMQLSNPAPNNGTRGLLYPILKLAPEHKIVATHRVAECENVALRKCGDGCHFEVIEDELR